MVLIIIVSNQALDTTIYTQYPRIRTPDKGSSPEFMVPDVFKARYKKSGLEAWEWGILTNEPAGAHNFIPRQQPGRANPTTR